MSVCSEDPVLWNEELCEAKEKGKLSKHFCGWRRYSRGGSSHDHLRQSAQYLRSSSGHVRRIGLQNLCVQNVQGKLVAQDNPETTVIPTELTKTKKITSDR